MKVLAEEAPAVVQKRIIEDMDNCFYPTKPVVPYIDVVHDRAVLELFAVVPWLSFLPGRYVISSGA